MCTVSLHPNIQCHQLLTAAMLSSAQSFVPSLLAIIQGEHIFVLHTLRPDSNW